MPTAITPSLSLYTLLVVCLDFSYEEIADELFMNTYVRMLHTVQVYYYIDNSLKTGKRDQNATSVICLFKYIIPIPPGIQFSYASFAKPSLIVYPFKC